MRKVLWSVAAVLVIALAALAAIYFLAPGLVYEVSQRSARSAARLEAGSVQVGDHRIAYLQGGSGEPLVLLHGFGAYKDHWTPVARHLTGHFRVIAPDLPGFGESTHDPAATYGYAEQVERVRRFLLALGIQEPVHLGGNSMGGGIAGLFAARHPGQVRSLWLLAPAGVASAEVSELRRLIAQGDNPMLVSDAAGFERLLSFVVVRPPAIPAPVRRLMAARAVTQREANAKVFRDLVATPLTLELELAGAELPTLILWGDQDRLLHVSGAHILGALMPGAQVAILENVGHLPMLETPQESAARLLAFHKRQP